VRVPPSTCARAAGAPARGHAAHLADQHVDVQRPTVGGRGQSPAQLGGERGDVGAALAERVAEQQLAERARRGARRQQVRGGDAARLALGLQREAEGDRRQRHAGAIGDRQERQPAPRHAERAGAQPGQRRFHQSGLTSKDTRRSPAGRLRNSNVYFHSST
jgi:hypothetical protein